ncbi:peptidase S10, serine carboxypeptidase, alpha/beta hydrolase fold protein [Tanacetum coccineum]|uniref:Peptidase S10, serine carboxypeptidase, alpha/beta hydrolase fold protein n=1 Tax=Tanacetum coccineum TaxID=301880 RepID=A0ABQ5GP80_9ASTR
MISVIVVKSCGVAGLLEVMVSGCSYVGVGEREEVQLFYYFVESQRNPQKDPLLLYLTGGPGTSGILSLFYQIGPLKFEFTNSTRSEVKLELNPYSWTKTANVIFIDLPVGTGFSYAKTWESSRSSDSLVVTHAYDFIRKWLMDHPKFLSNPLYITGISYMGLIIPGVVSNVYHGNEQGTPPKLNIRGFLIVNPRTDSFIDFNSRIEFAYRAALIEDEIYERNKTVEESIYSYSNIWGNMKSVRQALHIRKGTVENFQFRNASISAIFGKPDAIYYSYDIFSSLAYHKQLFSKKCHALIINGDQDMTFPYVGTQQWIKSLNLNVESPWKPWFVRTQVAGYQKTYSNAKYSLMYATIKGAGHSVAIYKPEESMVIVETWLASHTNSSKS